MAKEKPTFEQSLAELEAIVAELEGGNLPLDKMMERHETGMKALENCRKILAEAEKKIEILLKGANGELKREPFEPKAEG